MGLVTASGPSPAPSRVFSSAGAQAKFGACAPQSVSQSVSPLGQHRKFPSLFLALAPLLARKPTRKATNTDYLAADCPARAHPSSYFPIVGFPHLPYACALFSRPRLPRYQPRHCVASCCWHPPALGRSSLLRHRLETGNIKGTIDAPRLPACLFPHPHVPGADQRAGSQNSRRENQPPGDTVCDRPTDPATQTPPYFGGPIRQPCG